MNRHRQLWALCSALACTLTAAANVQAQSPEHAVAQAPGVAITDTAVRALSPAQLSAIRIVGRNVLAAKKSGAEDPADAEQLARLRAALDALVAADLDPKNRSPITVQGHESGEQQRSRERIASVRHSARQEARALAERLRSRAELTDVRSANTPEQDTRSAGLPVGRQRARLFKRWSAKIEAAAADEGSERLTQLSALRHQLRATKGSVSDTPLTHATPTLQVQSYEQLPPKNESRARKKRK